MNEVSKGTRGEVLPKVAAEALLSYSDAATKGTRSDSSVKTTRVTAIQCYPRESVQNKKFQEAIYVNMSKAISKAFDERIVRDAGFTSFDDVVYGIGKAQAMTSTEVRTNGEVLPEGWLAVRFEIELGYKFNSTVIEWAGTEDESL